MGIPSPNFSRYDRYTSVQPLRAVAFLGNPFFVVRLDEQSKDAQSVSANTKQTYQRFAEERVRPGYQSNTKLKGLLSFTGPRFMPPPPFKK